MKKHLVIDSIEKLIEFSNGWSSKEFALDTETTGLEFSKYELTGIQMYDPRDIAYPDPVFIAFNFSSKYTEKIPDPQGGRKKVEVERSYKRDSVIDIDEARPYLLKVFDGARCICANAKFEWKVLTKFEINNWLIEDDVNIMSWMLNVSTPSGLKDNARRELKIDMTSYEETVGMKPNNINWNLVDWDEYYEYGCRDVFATWGLRPIYVERMKKAPEELWNCYRKLEIPLIYEVARSEMVGVSIDVPYLQRMSVELERELKLRENEIFDKVGVEFNIGSSKQLAEILFDRLGYPVMKTSEKTGARSCDEDTLKDLAFQGYEVADDILDFRKLQKLKSTYADAIPLMVDKDGRLRGNFNQAGTTTNRFSSSQPNLQNQPNNKKFPIKRAFVPKKGYIFIVADWSTIEIRIMAHESRCPVMCAVLNEGRDVHKETMESINKQFNLTLDRGQAKTINFGVLYLMSAKTLAYMLNKELKNKYKTKEITKEEYKERFITEEVAQKIVDGFFRNYTGFSQFVRDETRLVQKTGWSWTLGGHRRPVPELRDRKTFGAGQRIAVNNPIQGGSADLMKLGILKLAKLYKDKGYDANTLLYVHDEYVIEVRDDQAEELLKDVIYTMNNIFPDCEVPILCEAGIFNDWAGLKQGAKVVRRKVKQSLFMQRLIHNNFKL